MGAGFDTRCYGNLKQNNMKFFELDQPETQKLKVECLKKVDIDVAIPQLLSQSKWEFSL